MTPTTETTQFPKLPKKRQKLDKITRQLGEGTRGQGKKSQTTDDGEL